MSRRLSRLGQGWQLRPHQLDLTCHDRKTGSEIPVVQVRYGSPEFPLLTADEVLKDLPDNEAAWHLDVQVLVPEAGLRQVRHDPVGVDGRRMVDRARGEYEIRIDGVQHPVVRYRGVLDCPGCGRPIDYRVEKLLRLAWQVYGPGKHSMPHAELARMLGQTGAEH